MNTAQTYGIRQETNLDIILTHMSDKNHIEYTIYKEETGGIHLHTDTLIKTRENQEMVAGWLFIGRCTTYWENTTQNRFNTKLQNGMQFLNIPGMMW